MAAELAGLTAAQAKADEVIRAVGEPIDGRPMLRVAVTDPETNTRLATGFVSYEVEGQAPGSAADNVANPAERDLLVAVQEALTLPFDADGYERRIADRAGWVRATLKGYFDEGDPEWHAEYLRRKLRDEGARTTGGAS
ncbi:hypothetical protein OG713_34755 [Streptomyces sp. NBC_00723]|uniref:hypothetical protein n=1 Tax=Streptomyces sp. NBC_00723 TaxID=2903673 RepID=UPI00386B8FF2